MLLLLLRDSNTRRCGSKLTNTEICGSMGLVLFAFYLPDVAPLLSWKTDEHGQDQSSHSQIGKESEKPWESATLVVSQESERM